MAKKAWHLLDFSMQQQDQTNWCWAAVAASVVRYYHADTQWTQCRIAEGELRYRLHLPDLGRRRCDTPLRP